MLFQLEKFNGYLLLHANGKKYLLDTGCRNSFSDDGRIGDLTVGRESFEFIQNRIAVGIGCPVNGLLGFDGRHCLQVTDTAAEVLPSTAVLPHCAYFLPYTNGGHTVELTLNGHSVRMVCDLGGIQAMTAFPELLDGSPDAGSYRDWLCMINQWREVRKYRAEFSFPCGFRYTGEIGVIPEYAFCFRRDGIAGTLGNDLLNHYDLFFNREGVALLEKQSSAF